MTMRRLDFWVRLAITVGAMLLAGWLAGLIVSWLLGWTLPSYAAGVVGGLTALPVWHVLRRLHVSA